MFYAPHKMQVKKRAVSIGALGVPTVTESDWTDVSPCRCDHNTTADLVNDAGQEYKSSFHIVADKKKLVAEGDEIRCVDNSGAVVGGGICRQLKLSNAFDLMELWV